MKSFYLRRIIYYLAFAASVIFILSYFVPIIFDAGIAVLLFIGIGILADALLLYSKTKGIEAVRYLPDRFSNGDENKVALSIKNKYPYKIKCSIIDELPFQFQERKWKKRIEVEANKFETITYTLLPLERGEYEFGNINVYVKSPLNLIVRRYTIPQSAIVKVYPSYIQMRRYHLLAVANKLQQSGMLRMRKIGHSMEFEQIKEYVQGDDYRTINWKATARKGSLMINNFTDERSQQIYCIINKGRLMKMPFDGMTLLDYAINASLVLSNVALSKQDKAGIITFAENLDTFLLADKKPAQLNTILELLYKQETRFLEQDFEKLFSVVRNKITQRSLLILFTNFESVESLQREMPSLKKMAKYHLLMVVFFENTELKSLVEKKAGTIEDIYIQTIAKKFQHEKRLMVKELQQNGIIALLSSPQNLTVKALNKYLELKNRQSI